MHVLIADDDPGTRLLMGAAVQRLGHETTLAEDGDAAWAAYQAARPEVVITDWDMPGMDGTALIRAIRSHPGTGYAYAMVVTGAADEASSRAAMEAGADDLVPKPFDPAALERKLIAADRVTAMHRRMHEDARHDVLTGVGNRLRLVEDLRVLSGRMERYGHGSCVALLDVDHFKAYNDTAGHLAGDDVLRAVAGALRATIRSGDTLYRYGGEEFLVLLPEQTLERAALAAERLRAAVEALGIAHPNGGVVTVSVGVAQPTECTGAPEALLELADQALYRAKEAGRNRVEVHLPGPDGDGDGDGGLRLLVADEEVVRAIRSSARW